MELRQLRYFVAVIEQGSFSKAAEIIYVAQSALSHQVGRLEQELGTKLLHRAARGVTLTEPGRVFLAHAVAILRQASDARMSVQGSLDQPRGKVTLGLPPSVCSPLAVPLLLAAREELPGVELELTEEVTGSLAGQLRAGLINLALLFDAGELPQFAHRPLLKERLYVISKAAPGPAPRTSSITLEASLVLPLLLSAPAQGLRRIVERAARDNGLPKPNVLTEINSMSILRLALLAGIGHSILPPMALKQELDSGLLQGRLIRSPQLTRGLNICASKSIPMTPATLAIYQLVVRVTRELCTSSAWEESAHSH